MSNMSNAQRAYDNRSDDFDDELEYPEEMDCSECGFTVELDRNGIALGTGVCKNCENLCKSEPIN